MQMAGLCLLIGTMACYRMPEFGTVDLVLWTGSKGVIAAGSAAQRADHGDDRLCDDPADIPAFL
jgi:hypothetical protein